AQGRCGAGLRRRAAQGGRRVRAPRAAPQPDGDVRDDRGLVGRRQEDENLRQDPGRAQRAAVHRQDFRAQQGGSAHHLEIYGRRLRLGPAATVPGVYGRAGRPG
nr:hypothetical protein [Tanacetum cinerariifolium]